VLPDDPQVAALDAAGRAIVELPGDSAMATAMGPVVDTVLAQSKK
jgi:hypothetical protein